MPLYRLPVTYDDGRTIEYDVLSYHFHDSGLWLIYENVQHEDCYLSTLCVENVRAICVDDAVKAVCDAN